MRKLIAWIVVTLGLAALVRKLKRRRESDEPKSEYAAESREDDLAGGDPAGELRRRLAETRDDEAPSTAAVAPSEPTVDERRAEVHEHGRSTLGEMQQSTED